MKSKGFVMLVIIALVGILAVPVFAASALVPEDMVVITNRDSSDLALIDQKTDQIVGRVDLGNLTNPHMAMMTHGGKYILVAGSGKNEFIVVDFATLKVVKRIPVGQLPEHFDISHNDRYAAVGNFDESTVSIIDLASLEEVRRISGFFEPHGITFSPDGKKVYISNLGAHEVAVVDTETQQLAKAVAVADGIQYAAVDPMGQLADVKGIINPTLTIDGRFVYMADADAGQVGILDTQTDSIIQRIKVGAEPWRAYVSPDGRTMLVPNNGDKTVSVIRVKDHALIGTLAAGGEMTGINFSRDNKAYVISSEESAVYVYDLGSLATVNRLTIGQGLKLETASTTADGKKIYLTSSTDNSVYVIDTATDKVTRISDVGVSPWGAAIIKGENYCH